MHNYPLMKFVPTLVGIVKTCLLSKVFQDLLPPLITRSRYAVKR